MLRRVLNKRANRKRKEHRECTQSQAVSFRDHFTRAAQRRQLSFPPKLQKELQKACRAASGERRLHRLDLRKAGLGDGHVEALAEALKSVPVVRKLDLRGNFISLQAKESIVGVMKHQIQLYPKMSFAEMGIQDSLTSSTFFLHRVKLDDAENAHERMDQFSLILEVMDALLDIWDAFTLADAEGRGTLNEAELAEACSKVLGVSSKSIPAEVRKIVRTEGTGIKSFELVMLERLRDLGRLPILSPRQNEYILRAQRPSIVRDESVDDLITPTKYDSGRRRSSGESRPAFMDDTQSHQTGELELDFSVQRDFYELSVNSGTQEGDFHGGTTLSDTESNRGMVRCDQMGFSTTEDQARGEIQSDKDSDNCIAAKIPQGSPRNGLMGHMESVDGGVNGVNSVNNISPSASRHKEQQQQQRSASEINYPNHIRSLAVAEEDEDEEDEEIDAGDDAATDPSYLREIGSEMHFRTEDEVLFDDYDTESEEDENEIPSPPPHIEDEEAEGDAGSSISGELGHGNVSPDLKPSSLHDVKLEGVVRGEGGGRKATVSSPSNSSLPPVSRKQQEQQQQRKFGGAGSLATGLFGSLSVNTSVKTHRAGAAGLSKGRRNPPSRKSGTRSAASSPRCGIADVDQPNLRDAAMVLLNENFQGSKSASEFVVFEKRGNDDSIILDATKNVLRAAPLPSRPPFDAAEPFMGSGDSQRELAVSSDSKDSKGDEVGGPSATRTGGAKEVAAELPSNSVRPLEGRIIASTAGNKLRKPGCLSPKSIMEQQQQQQQEQDSFKGQGSPPYNHRPSSPRSSIPELSRQRLELANKLDALPSSDVVLVDKKKVSDANEPSPYIYWHTEEVDMTDDMRSTRETIGAGPWEELSKAAMKGGGDLENTARDFTAASEISPDAVRVQEGEEREEVSGVKSLMSTSLVISHTGLELISADCIESRLARFSQSYDSILRLDLSCNRLERINDSIFSSLPSLAHLDVSHNLLSTLKLGPDGGSEYSPDLRTLNASHNALTRIDGISECVNLQELDLSHNSIRNVSNLEMLRELKNLNLGFNLLSSQLSIRMLSFNVGLSSLTLEGCPIQEKDSYRPNIICLLPHIEMIDESRLPPSPAAARRLRKSAAIEKKPAGNNGVRISAAEQLERDERRMREYAVIMRRRTQLFAEKQQRELKLNHNGHRVPFQPANPRRASLMAQPVPQRLVHGKHYRQVLQIRDRMTRVGFGSTFLPQKWSDGSRNGSPVLAYGRQSVQRRSSGLSRRRHSNTSSDPPPRGSLSMRVRDWIESVCRQTEISATALQVLLCIFDEGRVSEIPGFRDKILAMGVFDCVPPIPVAGERQQQEILAHELCVGLKNRAERTKRAVVKLLELMESEVMKGCEEHHSALDDFPPCYSSFLCEKVKALRTETSDLLQTSELLRTLGESRGNGFSSTFQPEPEPEPEPGPEPEPEAEPVKNYNDGEGASGGNGGSLDEDEGEQRQEKEQVKGEEESCDASFLSGTYLSSTSLEDHGVEEEGKEEEERQQEEDAAVVSPMPSVQLLNPIFSEGSTGDMSLANDSVTPISSPGSPLGGQSNSLCEATGCNLGGPDAEKEKEEENEESKHRPSEMNAFQAAKLRLQSCHRSSSISSSDLSSYHDDDGDDDDDDEDDDGWGKEGNGQQSQSETAPFLEERTENEEHLNEGADGACPSGHDSAAGTDSALISLSAADDGVDSKVGSEVGDIIPRKDEEVDEMHANISDEVQAQNDENGGKNIAGETQAEQDCHGGEDISDEGDAEMDDGGGDDDDGNVSVVFQVAGSGLAVDIDDASVSDLSQRGFLLDSPSPHRGDEIHDATAAQGTTEDDEPESQILAAGDDCNEEIADADKEEVKDEDEEEEVIWIEGYDKNHECFYYFNSVTGESSWYQPEAPFEAYVPTDNEGGDDSDDCEEEDEEYGSGKVKLASKREAHQEVDSHPVKKIGDSSESVDSSDGDSSESVKSSDKALIVTQRSSVPASMIDRFGGLSDSDEDSSTTMDSYFARKYGHPAQDAPLAAADSSRPLVLQKNLLDIDDDDNDDNSDRNTWENSKGASEPLGLAVGLS